jgi:tRNA nucleotidyltransferase/poly(A) polymerase
MDYFLDHKHCVDRLTKEWLEYGKIIIAYDFDDTVYDYHNKGRKYDDVINLLRECKYHGAYFIVFTSCEEDKYDEMKMYLNDNDIPFDKFNEGMDFIPFKGRKVYYNILLDDRAGLESAYTTLKEALYIKQQNDLINKAILYQMMNEIKSRLKKSTYNFPTTEILEYENTIFTEFNPKVPLPGSLLIPDTYQEKSKSRTAFAKSINEYDSIECSGTINESSTIREKEKQFRKEIL